jgi:methyltransferase
VIRLAALLGVVAAFMVVEARRASGNERRQLARGGVEPRFDVYPMMQIAYPGVFLLMFAEGALHERPPASAVALGVALFAAGKILKWWAITELGDSWTFRVIVVPGTAPVRSGPYRYLRHPNYVGVAGELAGVALMTGAIVAGTLGTLFFGALMLARVKIEERALAGIEN